MTQKTSIFLVFILVFLNIPGQNADCSKLLVLTDTFYYAKKISGCGEKMEFKDNFNDNLTTFPKETNSIWYLIKSPSTGKFTFDIISDNPSDDWDFLLYEYKSLFCKRIDSNRIKPIRTNISRSANTGLSLDASELFSSSGLNTNYSKYVDVKTGDEFVLVVNNPKRSGSNHKLILHFPEIEKPLPVVTKNEVDVTQKLDFSIEIKDATTMQPISSNLTLTGLLKESIDLQNVTHYNVLIDKSDYRINIVVTAPDYMLFATKFKIQRSKNKFNETILLDKIEIGKKVSLEDIQFTAASDKFLASAKNSLKALLLFMQQNKSVSIEVEGHVNGPGQSNHEEFKKLSIDRALAVKKYLMENSIDEKRINHSGFGNSKMIYPDPKTDDEHSMNRRVEIKIISK